MAFLRRDFIHPEFSSWRKRDHAMTLFSDASGKLIAAYSYNTALAVVLPDAEQTNGIRIHLNISSYSKCTNAHMWCVRSRLIADYGQDTALAFAAEADNVPVGTSAEALPALCGATTSPEYVRERAVAGRQHLTMRDLRRTFHAEAMRAYADGSQVEFIFTTADEAQYMLIVEDGVLDYGTVDDYGEDADTYTLSPEAYAHVLATQGKLAALATARGDFHRSNGYRRYIDMTYSQRGVFTR